VERFLADRSYAGGIFVVRADGTALGRLSKSGGWPVWWPDGRQIGYLTVGSEGNQVVQVVAFEGGLSLRLDTLRYTDTNYPIAISPDGRLLATTNATHLSDEIWLLRPSGNR
jgi:Tol biopolymer transport system component